MDDGPSFKAEFRSGSSLEEDGLCPDQYMGAFFTGAQTFVVGGGNFKSITNITTAPTAPSDFRMVPIGDLDLREEIRIDCGSGVVNLSEERKSARRMYSARIHGSKSNITLGVYQGENATLRLKRSQLHTSEFRPTLCESEPIRYPCV
ncbi:hypothetical protein DFH09DRAFT_1368823 [Mycena vulgaris]|nr:hypothetical protein DFH09DRAFT_1368823 [Mycena vulgaris]